MSPLLSRHGGNNARVNINNVFGRKKLIMHYDDQGSTRQLPEGTVCNKESQKCQLELKVINQNLSRIKFINALHQLHLVSVYKHVPGL